MSKHRVYAICHEMTRALCQPLLVPSLHSGAGRSARSKAVAVQATDAAVDVDAWRRGFREADELEDGFYFLDDVQGLPKDLCGTYFRNGPGKFQEGQSKVVHELDGDGFVLALTFQDGRVCVRHRLVQTQGLLRDKFAKRIFAKGYYGTPPAEGGTALDPRKGFPKHTANAGMIFWEEQLLAVGTAGATKPYMIDPATLGTVLGNEDEGSWNLDGALDSETGFGSCPKVSGSLLKTFYIFMNTLNPTRNRNDES